MEPEFMERTWHSIGYLAERLQELEDVEDLAKPKVWDMIESAQLDIMTLKLVLYIRGTDLEAERERALFEGAIIRHLTDAIQQRGWRYYIARDGNYNALPTAGVWDEGNERIDEHSTAKSEAEALLTVYVAAIEAEMADKVTLKGQVDPAIRSLDTFSLE
ncbi:MAG: hypothetical protein MUO26_00475 [Methanotrichaceae archaeon]|nr:hypothetical protein [Methanotrichaceae archaeon]